MSRASVGLVVSLVIALAASPPPTFGQWVEANGEPPKAVDREVQQSAYGGQKEDLRLSVEDVRWVREPCEERPECTVIEGVELTVWVEWLNFPGPWLFGKTDLDSREQPEDQDGPDALIVQWEPGWVYESASGDPSRVGSTSVSWSSAANCPESPPLTGRHHVAERTDGSGKGRFGTFGFERTIKLRLRDTGEESCRVPSLQLRAEYLHSYDGDLHVSWGGSVALGISVDAQGNPSISVGTTVNFTNDHAWNKDETFEFDPPKDAVRRCNCCPQEDRGQGKDEEDEREDRNGETPSRKGAAAPVPSGTRLVLPPSVPSGGTGFGSAVGADGAILTGVVVAVGDEQTVTDDDGRFWIPGDLPTGEELKVRLVSESEDAEDERADGGPPVQGRVPVVPEPERQWLPPHLDEVPTYAGWEDFTVRGSGLHCDRGTDVAAYFGTTEAPILACDGQGTWTVRPAALDGGDLPLGPLDFYASVGGKASNVVPVVGIRLDLHLLPPELQLGQKGWAVYRILGAKEPVALRVTNRTPGVIRLIGGNPQSVYTSGGEDNEVRVRFQTLAPGQFQIHVTVVEGSARMEGPSLSRLTDGPAWRWALPVSPVRLGANRSSRSSWRRRTPASSTWSACRSGAVWSPWRTRKLMAM